MLLSMSHEMPEVVLCTEPDHPGLRKTSGNPGPVGKFFVLNGKHHIPIMKLLHSTLHSNLPILAKHLQTLFIDICCVLT